MPVSSGPPPDSGDFIYHPLSSSFSTVSPANPSLLLFGTSKARIRDVEVIYVPLYLQRGNVTGVTLARGQQEGAKGLERGESSDESLDRTRTRPMWVPLINRVYRVLFLALY